MGNSVRVVCWLIAMFIFGLITVSQAQERDPVDISLMQVIWSQPVDSPHYAISTSFYNSSEGLSRFAADNFVLEHPSHISKIIAYGTTHMPISMREMATTLSVKIIPDDNGKPLLSPLDDNELFVFSIDISTESDWLHLLESVETKESTIEIYLDGLLDEPLILDPGTYWLCLYFDSKYLEYSWNWRFSRTRSYSAYVIDPYMKMVPFAGEWYPFSETIGAYHNLAFKVKGIIYD